MINKWIFFFALMFVSTLSFAKTIRCSFVPSDSYGQTLKVDFEYKDGIFSDTKEVKVKYRKGGYLVEETIPCIDKYARKHCKASNNSLISTIEIFPGRKTLCFDTIRVPNICEYPSCN
jgi:hypothetical protein